MEPYVQENIIPIPAKVPHEGFDLKNQSEETAKDLRRDDQPAQCLMEAMQLELIDQNKAEVKGYILCLSALYPRGNNLK